MKKVLALLLSIACILSFSVTFATEAPGYELTIEEVIAPQYDDIYRFSEGLAAVKVGDKWGYIDETGKTVIKPQYMSVTSFKDGYAVVSKMGKTLEVDWDDDWNMVKTTVDAEVLYVIDTKGKETPLMGVDATARRSRGEDVPEQVAGSADDVDFNEGVIIHEKFAYSVNGNLIDPDFDNCGDEDLRWYNWYETYGVCHDDLIPGVATCIPTDDGPIPFLMDKTGKIVRIFPHTVVWNQTGVQNIVGYDEGLAILFYEVYEDWQRTSWSYGVMDSSDKWIVEPEIKGYRWFTTGRFFSDGLWVVSMDDVKYGAIDTTGKTVIPFAYDFLGSFSEGYASAYKDGKWSLIDTKGNSLVIPAYDGGQAKIAAISSVNSNGLAAVYDAQADTTYLIKVPSAGQKEAIVVKGSNILNKDDYFGGYEEETGLYQSIYSVREEIVTEKNGKYGLSRMSVTPVKADPVEPTDPSESFDPSGVANPFTDVAADAYYHDAVLWALENNVTTGTTATTFSPDATCTRGQVATFLWRAMGCPEPETTVNPFTDVKESDYYYKAVLWAFENNITTGTTATTFSPNNTCTSAHVITFLWRTAGKPAPTSFTGTEYYAEAAAWAAENNLTQGTAVPFAPANLSPRADIVTYLYRYLSK